MTREEEIEKILDDQFDTDLYDYETDNSYCNYCAGFIQGVEWADSHPKSHWVSVKEDLPCNHEELISIDDKRYTLYVVAVIHGIIILSRMYKFEGKWYWENYEPTHWMPIPKLPKE